MSNKKEITIDYLKRKTKILLPEKYSDFIEECKKTFFISNSRSENMYFKYIDEEGDENDLEEDDYKNEKVQNLPYWKLIVNDNDSETDEANNTKDELITIKNKILKKAKGYKSKKLKESNELIEKEMKKRNDEHKKNIEKMKNEYKTKIEEFKNDINSLIIKSLDDISQKLLDTYNKNIEATNNEIKNNFKASIETIGKQFEEDLSKVNMDDIGDKIETMKESVKGCMSDFHDIYNVSKNLKAICLIEGKIESKCRISKNSIAFNLKITNNTEQKLNGNYILDIRGEDNIGNFQAKLDLSDINSKEEKSKEIKFNPHIENEGIFNFTLYIKENGNIISNESQLKLTMWEIGSMNDMF